MKKILCLVLALALALSLVACGGSAASTSSAASSEAASADNTTEAAAPAEGAVVLKIGGIGPLTGPAADYGQNAMNGAQIAVDEINAMGGDIVIEFNAQDDEHDAEKSLNAYNTLKDWGMQALVGCVTTTPSLTVGPEAVADGYFMLTPSASAQNVADLGVYQMCFTDPNQGIASADYIAENGLATKIGILYDSSDVYSSGIKDKFVEEATVKGLEIVDTQAFTGDSKTDFSTQLQNLQNAGTELLFMPFYYNEATLVLDWCNKNGFAPIFFGVDGMDGILTVENFDTSLAEGLMLLTPFAADAQDEATVKFVTAYEAKYGATPSQFAADGYDCVFAIYEAAKAAGIGADASPADVKAALDEQFLSMTFDGITGNGMTWAADHTVSKGPKAVTIKDGVYVGN